MTKRRRPIVPVPDLRPNPFGFSRPMLIESPEETAARVPDIIRTVTELFDAAADCIGADRTREIFETVAKRERGAPAGPRDVESDRALLMLFDCVVEALPPNKRRHAASRIAKGLKGEADLCEHSFACEIDWQKLVVRFRHTETESVVRYIRVTVAERARQKADRRQAERRLLAYIRKTKVALARYSTELK